MNAHPIIDYESSVSEYMENLNTILRGFKAREDAPFLETWVPDDDAFISILSMFESGKAAGIAKLTVCAEATTLAAPVFEKLQAALAAMGQLDTQTEGQSITLTVCYNTPALKSQTYNQDSLNKVSKAYRERLISLDKPGKYEAVLSPEHGYVLIGTSGTLRLTALIEPERHLVHKVRHFGASTEIERRLLDCLCSLMEGKPLLECSDHAVIELEHVLRSPNQPLPVFGIITPESADPMFLMPLKLVRALLDDYREKCSYDSCENFYIKPCSHRWNELSTLEREAKISAALNHFPGSVLFQLVTMEGDRRVVVQVADCSSISSNGSELLQLEKYMQQRVEPVLQVYLQPKVDLNTIRKIKEIPA